jgi:hypothetical protein
VADRRQTVGENEKPVRDQDKVMLRLPDGMRERLKEAAKSNTRSMNAEIVARLEESFTDVNAEGVRETITFFKKALESTTRSEMAAIESMDATRAVAAMQGEQISELTEQLKRMTEATLTFGQAFQRAAEGDGRAIEEFLALAAHRPLPRSPQLFYERFSALLDQMPEEERPAGKEWLTNAMRRATKNPDWQWNVDAFPGFEGDDE